MFLHLEIVLILSAFGSLPQLVQLLYQPVVKVVILGRLKLGAYGGVGVMEGGDGGSESSTIHRFGPVSHGKE